MKIFLSCLLILTVIPLGLIKNCFAEVENNASATELSDQNNENTNDNNSDDNVLVVNTNADSEVDDQPAPDNSDFGFNVSTNHPDLYASSVNVEMTAVISTSKAKAKPGDVVRFTVNLSLTNIAVGDDSDAVVATAKIPDNMTFNNNMSPTGSYSSGTVTFSLTTDDLDGGSIFFDAKVNEDIVERGIKSTTAAASVNFAGEIYDSDTLTVNFTEAYKVKYDINGGEGSNPVDDNYYSAELGEQADVKSNSTSSGSSVFTRPGYNFVGWNTRSDGTGMHFHMSDAKFTPTKDNDTLYAMWAKYSLSYKTDKDRELVYRGNIVTVTANVEYPESSSSVGAPNKLVLPVLPETTYIRGSLVKPIGVDNITDDNIEITMANYIATTYTFSYQLKVTDSLSFNFHDKVSALVNFGYNGSKVETSQRFELPVTTSYRIIYDGNGSDIGEVPVDNNFYSPFYNDLCTVAGSNGEFRKTGYSFTYWNYAQDGSGSEHYPGDKFTPFVDQTWYAQWSKVSISTINEHGKDKVRRGETIEFITTLDFPESSQYTYYDLTLPDELEFTGEGISPASGVIEGKTIKWERVFASSDGFSFKFKARVSEDASINDLKSIRINPKITTYYDDIYAFHDIDLTRSYKPTFDINGGLGQIYYNRGPQFMSPEYYDRLTLPSNKDNKGAVCVYRGGYTFNGWNTAADGTGTHYASEDYFAMTEDTTYYVEWKPNTYTVNFDKNDADATGQMSPISAVYDSTSHLPSNSFAKDGSSFVGWNTERDGSGTTFIDGDEILNLTELAAGEVTLYAQWTNDFKTVTFNTNSGSVLSDIKVPTGNTLKKPADPTKLGYKLTGWFTDEGLDNEFAFATPVTDNMTLFAKWSPVTYTVTFKGNGATSGSDFTETSTYDKPYSLSDLTFAKTNYTFSEWNTAEDGTGTSYKGSSDKPFASELLNLADTQDSNINLYAIWSPGTYTIHFDKNDTDATGNMEDMTVDMDESFQLARNKFEKSGYVFAGWTILDSNKQVVYVDGATVKNLNTAGRTTTLYAVWANNYHTIEFNSNGDSVVSSQYVADGYRAVRPSDPIKAGYTFDRWMNGDSVFDFGILIHEDLTLTGTWRPNNYKIHFDRNGGDSENMEDFSVTYDKPVNLPAIKFGKIGYTFVGWSTDPSSSTATYKDGETVKNLTQDADGEVVLYAIWKPNTCTIRFNANGGEGSMPNQTFTYDSPQKLNLNTFTREGYVFLGWNDMSSASSIMFSDGETVKNLSMLDGETFSLYAMWSSNAHLVKFDSNGGTNVIDQYVHDGRTATQPTDPNRNGYVFLGWMNGDLLFNFDTPITDDITLQAKWVASSFSVKFDGNGADSGTMIEQSMTYDVPANLSKNTFLRSGYSFAGWNTEASGAGKTYADGQSVSNLTDVPNGTFLLYATWVAVGDAVSVEFDAGDGSDVVTQYVERGTKLQAPVDPIRLGYTFIGWYNGDALYDFDVPVSAPIKLTGKWTANTYTIVFSGNGEDDGEMQPMSLTYDVPQRLSKNEYSKKNYHFIGWRLLSESATFSILSDSSLRDELIADEAEVLNLTPEQNGKVTLEAVWEGDSFNITYMNVEDSMNNNPSSYTYGEGVSELLGIQRDGYTFEGWFSSPDFSGSPVTSVAADQSGDITLYAKWTEIAFDPEKPFEPDQDPSLPEENPIKSGENTSAQILANKVLSSTGDMIPFIVGGVVVLLLVAGGIAIVAVSRKNSK